MTDAEARIVQLEKRLGLLEKAVRSYGIPIPSAYDGVPTETMASPAVRELARQNRMLEAVKLLVGARPGGCVHGLPGTPNMGAGGVCLGGACGKAEAGYGEAG